MDIHQQKNNLDFSHCISFPNIEGYEPELLEKIKKVTPAEHFPQIFQQSNKLRALHENKTQKMVYIFSETYTLPRPKANTGQEWLTQDDISLEELNNIAADIPITIVTGVANPDHCYAQACLKYGLQPNIKKFIGVPQWFIKNHIWSTDPETKEYDDTVNCNKLFIVMFGRPKLPRVLLAIKLWNSGLLHDAYWSWHGGKSGLFPTGTDIDNLGWPKFKTTFPLYEDKILGISFTKTHVPKIPKEYFDSFIELSVESMVEPHQILTTEKTLRPYMMSKPCLQLAHYGHYQHLESLGFELYTELFDYDEIERPSLSHRIQGINNNLLRLNAMPREELVDKVNSCKAKIKQNHKLVFSIDEKLPTAEIQYLCDHHIYPTDNYSNKKLSSIGLKTV